MKINKSINQFRNNRLAVRLLLSILIFSSVLTLIITILQLYLIYDRDVAIIHERLKQIEVSYTKSIENSLWDLDDEQSKNLLEGILRLPDIAHVEIINKHKKSIMSAGKPYDTAIIKKSIALTYTDQLKRTTHLGSMQITATKLGIYEHLKVQLLVILSSQAIKTFLVSIFILSIFHMLVTRHLARISNYTQNIKQLQFNQALELKRKNHTPENHDELDSIVLALNEMRDLAQLIPEMIFEVDLTGKIIFINQIAHKMSGYSHEDFKKGMTIFDLLIPEQHDLVKENIKKNHSWHEW